MKQHHLRGRGKKAERGAALTVAMLVVVGLSAVGVVALNAASYDLASSGAVRWGTYAETVAEGGMVVGQCHVCNSIDGVVVAMNQARYNEGRSAQYVMNQTALAGELVSTSTFFETPTAAPTRGSFGYLGAAPATTVTLRMDRPRLSKNVRGYSLREGAGSDAAMCHNSYRLTSDSTFQSPGSTTKTLGRHRAFVQVGPIDCSTNL